MIISNSSSNRKYNEGLDGVGRKLGKIERIKELHDC